MNNRKIKVKFVDFWAGYIPGQEILWKLLNRTYELELSDNPDYLFYSIFGDENLTYDNCIKVFYTGENIAPNFNCCDYAIGYEYMDFGDRYFRYPLFYSYEKAYNQMMRKHDNPEKSLASKKGFCSFVYSNGDADPKRQEFFDKLNQYKLVSSGGRYLNNVGGFVKDKREFELNFKFSMAFENSSHPGYITEKLVTAFSAETVPIYWGDATVGTIFNEKSFINCHNYSSVDDVIEEIKRIDKDDEIYQDMLGARAIENAFYNREAVCDRLEKFLLHIVEQPVLEAKRYCREGVAKSYRKNLKKSKLDKWMLCVKSVIKKRLTWLKRNFKNPSARH